MSGVSPSRQGLDFSLFGGDPDPAPPLRSLDPDEQAVEERAALLLGDPLDLRVAEARVQGLAVADALGSHLVGAGADAHLEAHLSVVAAVRARVLKSEGRTGEFPHHGGTFWAQGGLTAL